MFSGYDDSFASIITFIEVYAYDFTSVAEKTIVDEIMNAIEVIELNSAIADQSIIYRKNKIKKIKLPDAIILATAKYLGADLITNDGDDFAKIDPLIDLIDIEEFRY